MKTVGEILRNAREAKGISLDELSNKTKIDLKYLSALEADNYARLPSTTFTKGFIRNTALSLDKNPAEMIALFRRDFQHDKRRLSQSTPNSFSLHKPSALLTQAPLFIFLLLLFFGYLGFQYRTVLIPPKLEIVRPIKNQVLTSPISIEGLSTPDSIITINDQKDFNTENTGHFLIQFSLPEGTTTLQVSANNRFGRVSRREIPLTIISQ